MKLIFNQSHAGTDLNSISVSRTQHIWDEISSTNVNVHDEYITTGYEENQDCTLNERHAFVSDWTVHNNEIIKPSYEYKPKDEFIVDW